MLREMNVQRLHWADKTMSLLRQSQLESCEKRLNALPDYGLYTYDDNLHAEELWDISFDAQEEPRQLQLQSDDCVQPLKLFAEMCEVYGCHGSLELTHNGKEYVLHSKDAPFAMIEEYHAEGCSIRGDKESIIRELKGCFPLMDAPGHFQTLS